MNAPITSDRSRAGAPLQVAAAVLTLLVLALLGFIAAGAAGGPRPEAGSPPAVAHGGLPLPAAAAAVERGRYLVATSGCHDCHTPWVMGPAGPEPDMSRALSGHPQEMALTVPPALGDGPWVWAGAGTNTAFAGPWGISFSANLTPDPSGLDAWDEEIFVNAIRTGKHFGQSRPILPPMPWPVYRNMTDSDLQAIFAYLRTIPAVSNHVPEPLPPGATVTAEAEGADAVWTPAG